MHEKLAEKLHQTRLKGLETQRLTAEVKELSLVDAYAIQAAGIQLRLRDGEKIVGMKMGLTSEAKRKQMNLDSPVYGVLTNEMQCQNGGMFSLTGTIHPKIEPEIAFLMDKEIRQAMTREEVLGNCKGIAAAMEILDSRYVGFKYFSLPDVVADNSSSSHFVLGDWCQDFKHLDLKDLTMSFRVNGEEVHQAKSSAISGDPVLSLVQMSELLETYHQTLPAGSIVLAGAATAAIALAAGMEVSLEISLLDRVVLTTKP